MYWYVLHLFAQGSEYPEQLELFTCYFVLFIPSIRRSLEKEHNAALIHARYMQAARAAQMSLHASGAEPTAQPGRAWHAVEYICSVYLDLTVWSDTC